MSEKDPVVDWANALRMADDDEEMLRDLATSFLTTGPEQLALVRAAHASDDFPALAYAAHRLRGSVGIFQAHAALDKATTVERDARAGAVHAADVDVLEALVRAVCSDLTTRLASA